MFISSFSCPRETGEGGNVCLPITPMQNMLATIWKITVRYSYTSSSKSRKSHSISRISTSFHHLGSILTTQRIFTSNCAQLPDFFPRETKLKPRRETIPPEHKQYEQASCNPRSPGDFRVSTSHGLLCNPFRGHQDLRWRSFRSCELNCTIPSRKKRLG